MSISQTTFEDIFEVINTVIQTSPDEVALDPIDDLKNKSRVRIPYVRKPKLNKTSAFMTIKKKHKNWIGLLLGELCNFAQGPLADNLIMRSSASAKSNVKRSKQDWNDFVTELHQDKIINRDDISEAQARQLVRLIDLLSATGHRLKGAGTIEFVDETGEVLV